MSEWSDKDLEELFRRAANEEEFPYDPEAWRLMEQLLDKRRRRGLLLWWFHLGIGLGILVALLWFFWPMNHAPMPNQAPRTIQNEQTTPPASVEPKAQIEPLRKEPATSKESKNSSGRAPEPPAQASKEVHSNAGPSTGLRTAGTNPVAVENTGALEPEEVPSFSNVSPTPAPTPTTTADEPEPPAFLPILPLEPLVCPAQRVLASALPPESADSSILEKSTLPSSWGLALLAGGELISIGRDDYNRSNFRIGISVERRYADRYGISLGAHYVRFNYVADAGEYTPPKGFWTRKIAPVRTYGHCTMVELPLELHYYHPLDDGSRLNVSMGMVSFIMVRQRYYYMYDRPDPDLIRKWRGDKPDGYWLSAAMVSAGYQVPLFQHFNLGIRPYAQMPLAGIGHGKVKMYSVGLALQFGWSP